MLLSISTTHNPATDLGYLLFKHPERAQVFDTNWGDAHVFYPEATDERCTVAMVLEVDHVKLVRGAEGSRGDKFTLDQYTNDRPYAANSFLTVAMRDVFGTAFTGRSSDRPELAESEIPLEVELPVVKCPGDGSLIRELFEPLGYDVDVERHALDPEFPEWGNSPYFSVKLRGDVVLADMLSQVYLLLPVIDGEKHYWVDDREVEKLERHGDGWLEEHPRREFIARRALKYQRGLANELVESFDTELEEADEGQDEDVAPERDRERPDVPLNTLRMEAVVDALVESGGSRVLDLGCGEGKLLARLRDREQFTEVVGIDVSYTSLERAARRLKLMTWPDIQSERVKLRQGSLLYRDATLEGFDAAALVEVIEHLEPSKLDTLEEVVFEHARPRTVIVTTPNAEFNTQWDGMEEGDSRHSDHRFEWSRKEFQKWAQAVCETYEYRVEFRGIGQAVEDVGTPTQMGVFTR
jgi:3' terminal RNA ribose 2'-O-methyltransferase Hen1